MSNDSMNTSFVGEIIDSFTQASNIQDGVQSVLLNNGVNAGPQAFIDLDNSSADKTADLSVQQLLAMQYQPLLVKNYSASTYSITLAPLGETDGNAAAFALQQAFNMSTGTSVFLHVAQFNTPGNVKLQGNTAVKVLNSTEGSGIIRVAAGVIGDATNSTVTITSWAPTGVFFQAQS